MQLGGQEEAWGVAAAGGHVFQKKCKGRHGAQQAQQHIGWRSNKRRHPDRPGASITVLSLGDKGRAQLLGDRLGCRPPHVHAPVRLSSVGPFCQPGDWSGDRQGSLVWDGISDLCTRIDGQRAGPARHCTAGLDVPPGRAALGFVPV
jgi:hypothetical protein